MSFGRVPVLGSAIVQRVSVVGNSGSGKSTVARELAAALGVPYLELDSVFHQPGWEPLPEDEFRGVVEAAAAGDSWVMDGNYSAVRPLVWARADTVLWLDLPKWIVMRRVVWSLTVEGRRTRHRILHSPSFPYRNWDTPWLAIPARRGSKPARAG